MLSKIISFFDMGGYGIYIWPCYALLLLTLTWQVLRALRKSIYMRDILKQNVWSGTNSDPQS